MITTPCSWRIDPKFIETTEGERIYVIKPGCDQRQAWGQWYYRQFKFCPLCGHPIDHTNDLPATKGNDDGRDASRE
jgi:hypothetical protein